MNSGLTVSKSSFGFWFVFLNGDPLAGGYLTEKEAINEMERFK